MLLASISFPVSSSVRVGLHNTPSGTFLEMLLQVVREDILADVLCEALCFLASRSILIAQRIQQQRTVDVDRPTSLVGLGDVAGVYGWMSRILF